MNVTAESCGQAVILNCKGELTADSLDAFKWAVEQQLEIEVSKEVSNRNTLRLEPRDDSSQPARGSGTNTLSLAGGGSKADTSPLETSSSASVRDIVLNLEAVGFVDSAALEYLLDLQEQLAERLGQVKLVGLDGNVTKIFEVTRLDNAFERFEDVSEAVKSM